MEQFGETQHLGISPVTASRRELSRLLGATQVTIDRLGRGAVTSTPQDPITGKPGLEIDFVPRNTETTEEDTAELKIVAGQLGEVHELPPEKF